MKKASSSLFVLVLFAAMVSQVNAQGHRGQQSGGGQGSFDPNYGQQGSAQGGYSSRTIAQRVSQSLGMREVRRVSEILRLAMAESMELEATSITISATALRQHALIDISSRGRLISSQIVRRQLSSITILLPARSRLDDLEISGSDDLFLDSISVEVEGQRGQRQLMRPMPGQMLRLEVREDIYMSGSINLKQLVRQQLGLTLEGAQIERIAIQAQVLRGRSASVQVEMNHRLVGPIKIISPAQVMTPIPLNSFEDVRGSLELIISGDVVVNQINIRIGQVRGIW